MICCCCCYCDFRDWSKSCSLFNYSNTISLFSSRLYLTRIGRSNKKIYLPVTLTLNKEGGCLSGPNLKLKSQLAVSFMSHFTVQLVWIHFLKVNPTQLFCREHSYHQGRLCLLRDLESGERGAQLIFASTSRNIFFVKEEKTFLSSWDFRCEKALSEGVE